MRDRSPPTPTILLVDDDGILIMLALNICALHFDFSLQGVFTDDHFRSADRACFFFHGDHALDSHDILIINSYPLFPEDGIIFPSSLQCFHALGFPVRIEPLQDHFIVLCGLPGDETGDHIADPGAVFYNPDHMDIWRGSNIELLCSIR